LSFLSTSSLSVLSSDQSSSSFPNDTSGFFVGLSSQEPGALHQLLESSLTPWIHSVPLPVGDIAYFRDGKMLFLKERKTTQDIKARYIDFKSQRVRMKEFLKHNPYFASHSRLALLIEYSDTHPVQSHRPAVLGKILSDTTQVWNIPVQKTGNMLDTILLVLQDAHSHMQHKPSMDSKSVVSFFGQEAESERSLLHKTAIRELDEPDDVNEKGEVLDEERKRMIRLHAAQLHQLDGVSQEMAIAIAKEYPTVRLLIAALETSPPGRALRIKRALMTKDKKKSIPEMTKMDRVVAVLENTKKRTDFDCPCLMRISYRVHRKANRHEEDHTEKEGKTELIKVKEEGKEQKQIQRRRLVLEDESSEELSNAKWLVPDDGMRNIGPAVAQRIFNYCMYEPSSFQLTNVRSINEFI